MNTIITLLSVALLLFFFEIVVPGGILAIMGACLVLAACVITFTDYGAMPALAVFVGSMVVSLLLLFLELKILPKTKYGKRLFLLREQKTSSLSPQAGQEIIGQRGETITTMAPTGMVLIDGEKYEAFSQSGLLEKGTPVAVVKQDPFRLIVEKTE